MKIKYKIRNEKLKYDINREAAKISALSPVKIDKYEYLQVCIHLNLKKGYLLINRFTYYPLGKALKKQRIDGQGEK